MFNEIKTKRVLVFGCGNVLLGDDGFGSAVVKKLAQRPDFPEYAHAEDVGTSIRGILFDIVLQEERPEHIIVIDAVDKAEKTAGDVFEISVDEIPQKKIADYSFHQFPTSNLLKEVQDGAGIKVTVIAAQTAGKILEVHPGLSAPMRVAVRRAVDRVMELLRDGGS